MNSQLRPRMRLSRHALLALALAIFTAVPFARAASGAPTRETYNVAAGAAGPTLKAFSELSGRGVIVGAIAIEGVTTNAVRGTFTAREALDRMLANTGLVARLDEATGAFAIARANPESRPPRPAPTPPGNRSRRAFPLPAAGSRCRRAHRAQPVRRQQRPRRRLPRRQHPRREPPRHPDPRHRGLHQRPHFGVSF